MSTVSNVEKEILEVTGARKKKSSESEQDYLERIVDAVFDVDEDDWAEMSEETQTWYNEAAKAVNKQQEIKPFPGDDEEEEEEEDEKPRRGRGRGRQKPAARKPARGSRRSRKDEEEEEEPEEEEEDVGNGESLETDDLEPGMQVSIETEDDEFEGKVKKVMSSKVLLTDEDGETIRIPIDDIEAITSMESEEEEEDEENEEEEEEKPSRSRRSTSRKAPAKKGRRTSKRKEEPEDEEEDEEGETVEFDDLEEGQNVRVETEDEEIEGEVVSVLPRTLVVKPAKGGKRARIAKKDIENISLVEGDEEEEEEEEKPSRSRRSTSKGRGSSRTSTRTSTRGKGRTSSKEAKTPGVRTQILEILCRNPKLTAEKVKERLEKKGVEVKPQTINLAYSAFKETMELLEKHGKLA